MRFGYAIELLKGLCDMSWIILDCSNPDFVNIVTKDDNSGETMYFETEVDAKEYAGDCVQEPNKVVEL